MTAAEACRITRGFFGVNESELAKMAKVDLSLVSCVEHGKRSGIGVAVGLLAAGVALEGGILKALVGDLPPLYILLRVMAKRSGKTFYEWLKSVGFKSYVAIDNLRLGKPIGKRTFRKLSAATGLSREELIAQGAVEASYKNHVGWHGGRRDISVLLRLGKLLKQSRIDAMMSSVDASRIVGRNVCNYERGSAKPPQEVLEKMCKLYGVSAEDVKAAALAGGEGIHHDSE